MSELVAPICQKIKVVRSCVCQVAGISKRSNDKQKSFFRKRRVTIRDCKKSDFLNSNMC